jgi:hypothetical protein
MSVSRDMPGHGETFMGMMDKAKEMKDKAMDAVSGDHVDRAADKLDDATGNQHSDKIDKGRDMAKDQLDKHQNDQSQ